MELQMPKLHVGQGTHLGAMSVFPVWVEDVPVRGLATGADAQVRVAEREGTPVVRQLVLANVGAKPVLLVAGELFEGGWQHRALDHDVVLLSGQSMVAGVSCVEMGRWHGDQSQVRRARRASVMVRAVQQTAPDAQRQVWERVSRYDAAFGASATSSYVDHLDRAAARQPSPSAAKGLLDKLRGVWPLAGQRGVLIGLGGQPALLELFGSTGAFSQHLLALLEAAAVDAALLPAAPTPGRRARRMVEQLGQARLAPDPECDSGAGRALLGRSAHHQVRGIAWAGQVAHATVFNNRHPLLAAA